MLCNEVSDVHDNVLLKEKLDVSETSDIFRLSNINSPSVLKKKRACRIVSSIIKTRFLEQTNKQHSDITAKISRPHQQQ